MIVFNRSNLTAKAATSPPSKSLKYCVFNVVWFGLMAVFLKMYQIKCLLLMNFYFYTIGDRLDYFWSAVDNQSYFLSPCTEFQIRFSVSVQKGLVTRRQATRGTRRLIFQVVAIKHATGFFFFYSSAKHLQYFKLSDRGEIKEKAAEAQRCEKHV